MALSVVAAPAVERLLSKLKDVKSAGADRFMALCPAHDDKQRSLSIRVGKDGRVVMFCHANCATTAIVAAIGLTMSDLFSEPLKPTNGIVVASAKAPGVEARPKLVQSYDYYKADGTLAFQSCRFEPKTFRQRHRNGNGEWVYNLDGVTPILYRLPEVLEAVASERRIFIVEGEKDADTLAEMGYPATTSPMGAGKWRESYAEPLTGAEIVILPDNDDAGRVHAEQVAASLTARRAVVRVLVLPNLPPKGDITDWLDAGNSVDELEALIGRTPRWTADPIQAQHRTRWLLRDVLLNDEIMRPPPPVVPYLAWASRSTLLAAREKSGKSTLTGFMAAQVSRGEPFLDEPCDQGHVLIIGLEEFLGDTARRLREFQADLDRVSLVDHFAGPSDSRLDEITGHITAVKPVLVILDSLIAYSQGVITDASNSTQTQATVQGLTTLAHQTGVALVIIHHARKSDGKYRDSSAIGGAVDIIAEVFPPDEIADPYRRRVRPLGRVPTRAVDFRLDGNGYTRCDASGPQKAPIEQRILDVIRERPGISANAIGEAISENRKMVLERVKMMVHQKLILNDGNANFYQLRLPTFPPRLGFA